METKEIEDLVISALALALAFGISFSGGFSAFSDIPGLAFAVFACLIAVSSGFVLHELGHRFVARKFKCRAEYQMWPTGLILALVFSLFGFVFAAPGAVMIYPRISLWGKSEHLSRKAYGIVSLAGPVLNMVLALVFMALNYIHPSIIFQLGQSVNVWLALFNLIPIPPFDGIKIFLWDRKIWLGVSIIAVIMLFLF